MSLVPSSTSSPISLDQLLYNGSQISSQTWYSLSSVENSLKETVAICKDSIAYRVDQTNQLLVSVPSKKEPQQIYLQTHDISNYLNKLKQTELHRNFKGELKYTDEFCWSYMNRLFATQQVEQLQFSEKFRSKYILIREKTIYDIDLLENLQPHLKPGDVIVPILDSQIQSKNSVKEVEVSPKFLTFLRTLFSLHTYNFDYVCMFTNGKAIEKICCYQNAVDWLNEPSEGGLTDDDDYRSYYTLFPKLAHSDMMPEYYNERMHLEIEIEQIQSLYLFNQTFIVKD